jgi:hypothetical protein
MPRLDGDVFLLGTAMGVALLQLGGLRVAGLIEE